MSALTRFLIEGTLPEPFSTMMMSFDLKLMHGRYNEILAVESDLNGQSASPPVCPPSGCPELQALSYIDRIGRGPPMEPTGRPRAFGPQPGDSGFQDESCQCRAVRRN